jgi:hypothetical protein
MSPLETGAFVLEVRVTLEFGFWAKSIFLEQCAEIPCVDKKNIFRGVFVGILKQRDLMVAVFLRGVA